MTTFAIALVCTGLGLLAVFTVGVLLGRRRRHDPEQTRSPEQQAGSARVTRRQALVGIVGTLTLLSAVVAAALRRPDDKTTQERAGRTPTGSPGTTSQPDDTQAGQPSQPPQEVSGSGNGTALTDPVTLRTRSRLHVSYTVAGAGAFVVSLFLLEDREDVSASAARPVCMVEHEGPGELFLERPPGTYRLSLDAVSMACACSAGCSCPAGFRWRAAIAPVTGSAEEDVGSSPPDRS